MNETVRGQIAARLRSIVGAPQGDLADTARRLGVDEVALRMSTDDVSPYPTIDVIAAVVNEFGIDPTWILTGRYDEGAHRRVLHTPAQDIPAAITEMIQSQDQYPIPRTLRLEP